MLRNGNLTRDLSRIASSHAGSKVERRFAPIAGGASRRGSRSGSVVWAVSQASAGQVLESTRMKGKIFEARSFESEAPSTALRRRHAPAKRSNISRKPDRSPDRLAPGDRHRRLPRLGCLSSFSGSCKASSRGGELSIRGALGRAAGGGRGLARALPGALRGRSSGDEGGRSSARRCASTGRPSGGSTGGATTGASPRRGSFEANPPQQRIGSWRRLGTCISPSPAIPAGSSRSGSSRRRARRRRGSGRSSRRRPPSAGASKRSSKHRSRRSAERSAIAWLLRRRRCPARMRSSKLRKMRVQ